MEYTFWTIVLHLMQEKTGMSIKDIPLDDEKVLSMLCDTGVAKMDDIPEFGSEFTRSIIALAKPSTFENLVKISAISHGTDVWDGNQKELVETGQISLADCIESGDDIMLYLMKGYLPMDRAYKVMEAVGKGKGLRRVFKLMMIDADVPEWFINVCEKAAYLCPKAHAISYTILGVWSAYYKLYYSKEHEETLTAMGEA